MPEDADQVWRYRRLEEVSDFMTTMPGGRTEFAAFFADSDRIGRTLVAELADQPGAVIGDLMVRQQDAWAQTEVAAQAAGAQAEIGWAFDPEHHGRGYATEAAHELLRLCFEDLGVRRVEAICFADNGPSWRLMERLGMRREAHTVEDGLHRSGVWMDGFTYAMLDREWRARE